MTKKLLKVLAINPGSSYVGVAVFEGSELKDWRLKVIKPNVLAIKRLHPSRRSINLNQLVSRIKQLSKRKGLKIVRYSIKDLETFFSPAERINKKKLAEMLATKYPALWHEFDKERHNKNPYHIRVFEAVALGAVCSQQLDKN
jgi:hypothetical protein